MYVYIYICIHHKRTVRGVTFFSSVIGAAYHCRDKTGRKQMKVKGKSKKPNVRIIITISRRFKNNVHRFLSVVKTRTNQTRGRHSFFLPSSLNVLHLSPLFSNFHIHPYYHNLSLFLSLFLCFFTLPFFSLLLLLVS